MTNVSSKATARQVSHLYILYVIASVAASFLESIDSHAKVGS